MITPLHPSSPTISAATLKTFSPTICFRVQRHCCFCSNPSSKFTRFTFSLMVVELCFEFLSLTPDSEICLFLGFSMRILYWWVFSDVSFFSICQKVATFSKLLQDTMIQIIYDIFILNQWIMIPTIITWYISATKTTSKGYLVWGHYLGWEHQVLRYHSNLLPHLPPPFHRFVHDFEQTVSIAVGSKLMYFVVVVFLKTVFDILPTSFLSNYQSENQNFNFTQVCLIRTINRPRK